MEGSTLQPPPALIPNFWAPGWNSIQSLNKFQEEIGGPLTGGNPGARLIEPAGKAAGEQPPSSTISGKPFLAIPMTTGPGVANAGDGQPTDQKPNGNNMPPEQLAQQGAVPSRPDYSNQISPPFVPQQGEWLVVPLFHVFGSEELSVLSPGIAELSPEPYIAVNSEDAKEIVSSPQQKSPSEAKVGEGLENVTVGLSVNGMTFQLPVRIVKDLPRGVAGIPAGLANLVVTGLPASGKLMPVEK
jgi:NADH-quinone oxidoreductase subunit G